MNAKDDRETNDQQIAIEDLSAENAEASKVKGGVKLPDCLIAGYQTTGHGGEM